jgi:hypothetical protein
MKTFWVLAYLDDNDQIRRQRYDNEDAAREVWLHTKRALFLDEVHRLESHF